MFQTWSRLYISRRKPWNGHKLGSKNGPKSYLYLTEYDDTLLMWCWTSHPKQELRIDISQTHQAQFIMGQNYLAFCTDPSMNSLSVSCYLLVNMTLFVHRPNPPRPVCNGPFVQIQSMNSLSCKLLVVWEIRTNPTNPSKKQTQTRTIWLPAQGKQTTQDSVLSQQV